MVLVIVPPILKSVVTEHVLMVSVEREDVQCV